MANVAKDFAQLISQSKSNKTGPYDTQATVKRVEGNTAWVSIPGGVDETPIDKTVNCTAGDKVQVRVSGGRAWITGNASAPPTDDKTANEAKGVAVIAQTTAVDAKETADAVEGIAQAAQHSADTAARAAAEAVDDAGRAQTAADTANNILTGMQNAATAAGTTLNGIYADAETAKTNAQTAITNAAQAKTAADNASEYAARALGNLSTVQSVSETLTWITQHGTMALTTDVTPDPTHVYFVADAAGDYTVGGVTYAIVTEPVTADMGTYYELSIDESLNNYVGTHLALDGEGLWLLPASSGTNKVLIATGAGSTYTTAGTYIIDSAGTTVASFKTSGITLGSAGDAQMFLDYNTLQMKDKDNNSQLYIGDLRGSNGLATVAETFRGDGYRKDFQLFCLTNDGNVTKVEVESVVVSNYTVNQNSMGYYIRFTTAPNDGDVIVITYTTSSDLAKQYTFGLRNPNRVVGPMSFVFGYGNSAESPNAVAFPNSEAIASGSFAITQGHAIGEGSYAASNGYALGLASHAEGDNAYATGVLSFALGAGNISGGDYSHSTGRGTNAGGDYSHAQNWETIASSTAQTAIGKCNVEDTANTYAVIVGNGDPINAVQSNALTIDWSGNVEAAGDIEDGSGNILADKADTSAVPTKTSDLTNDSGYITGYTETDPVFSASAASGITSSDITTWNNKSDFSGSYTDLTNKPTIPSKTSDLNNDSGFITTETDPTVPSWAKASTKPTYTASEVGALPDTTTIPTKTSDLTNDSGFVSLITEEKSIKDNVTVNGSGTKYTDGNGSVAKTGYTPLGVVGFRVINASSSGTNGANVVISHAYISGTTAYFRVKNTESSTAKVRVYFTILYAKA